MLDLGEQLEEFFYKIVRACKSSDQRIINGSRYKLILDFHGTRTEVIQVNCCQSLRMNYFKNYQVLTLFENHSNKKTYLIPTSDSISTLETITTESSQETHLFLSWNCVFTDSRAIPQRIFTPFEIPLP